jgi:rubrerythrin
MTREEAIAILTETQVVYFAPKGKEKAQEALDMAIEALSAETTATNTEKSSNCGDLISRADAIEAVASADETNGTIKVFSGLEIIDMLNALPSADTVSREFYEATIKVNHGLAKENIELKEQIESADRPSGEWIFNGDGKEHGKSWFICDQCGQSLFHKTNYCPNCGTYMRNTNNE